MRRTLILLGFSLATAIIGYAVGMAESGLRFSSAEESRERLTDQVRQLRTENLRMNQQIVNLERGLAVDKKALDQARRNIVGLETELASLQSELVFYKNIMAPSESSRGLQIDRMALRSAGTSGAYDFMVVLVQRGDNKNYLSGSARVNLVGLSNGQRETLALKDLSADIENTDIKLRYRYFQEVKGRLQLPDDFEPMSVQVTAKRDGSGSALVERSFDWDELTEN